MDAFLLDYGNLLLRWLHVIAAIAWLGESIYFVMLDCSLRPPRSEAARRQGVSGELWAVHGGGFYHSQKYLTSPAELPEDLHWAFWKAYATWLSGFALFALMYLARPEFYLVNSASPWAWAAHMSGTQASLLAIAFLVVGYVLYSRMCRLISPTVNRDGLLSIAVGVMMVGVSWLTVQIFPGRAAFLITGALMATCMSANVFFWIIPGQRRMVRALKAGQQPDPLDGQLGKQRSVHNTYFTLPVVFLMLSNHYAFTYTNPNAWIIMALFIFAGAAIRQYFVLRHTGVNQLRYPVAGVVMLAAIGWLVAPAAQAPAAQGAEAATLAQVRGIMASRCAGCHAAQPTFAGFAAAPAGVLLDSDAEIMKHVEQIKTVVASRYMPLGNLTQMTDDERALIARWNGL